MTDEINTEEGSEPAPKRRTFLGCAWRAAAGVLFLLVVLALLLPAVTPSGEPGRRCHCFNNLKNIMVAMDCYQAKYGSYPPAFTVDKQGRRMHSWRALVLEFLDPELYAKYDFNSPWNSPRNLEIAATMKKDGPYYCPSERPKDSCNTSYVMLVGPTAFSAGPTGRKHKEITDKPADTIAVVEMSPSGILWTSPYDLNVSEMSFVVNDPDQAAGPRSCHPGGANVAFADGHTDFLAERTMSNDAEERWKAQAECMKALITINGGEDMSGFVDR